MLIPREIFSIHRLCGAGVRFSLNGIRIERDEIGPVAVVTDGRKLLEVRWRDDESLEFPGATDEAVSSFGVILSREACKAAGMLVKKNKKRPLTKHVHLCETSANGTVPLRATDLDSTHLLETKAIEGRFPKWREVIVERSAADEARILVDPRLLAETLLALADVATTEYSRAVELRVPKDPTKAVHIIKTGDDRTARAALMPMNNP